MSKAEAKAAADKAAKEAASNLYASIRAVKYLKYLFQMFSNLK